jgi:hypothetical protein
VSPLAALLLCALAGCAGGEKFELHFAPPEGSRVRRTIEVDHVVLRTLDEYRRVGDGRPLLLRRTFEEAPSPFAGTSVVFTWVPEEGAYGKYYDAREASESALRDLTEDLDLRALLPASAVAVGDTWTASAAGLRDVLRREIGECTLRLASVQGSLATVDVSLQPAGRGTLVWDLGAKRAASLTLPGVSWRIDAAAPQGQK